MGRILLDLPITGDDPVPSFTSTEDMTIDGFDDFYVYLID